MGTQYLRLIGLVAHAMWDLSSQTMDQTCAPRMEVWNPNHWATREFWGGSAEKRAYEIVIQEHVAWVGPEGHQY